MCGAGCRVPAAIVNFFQPNLNASLLTMSVRPRERLRRRARGSCGIDRFRARAAFALARVVVRRPRHRDAARCARSLPTAATPRWRGVSPARPFSSASSAPLLAFVSQILLARWMGGFEFGIYIYAWTWVLLIGGMVDLGLGSAAQRFIPEYTEHKHFALLRGFLRGSRWLALIIATTVAARWRRRRHAAGAASRLRDDRSALPVLCRAADVRPWPGAERHRALL